VTTGLLLLLQQPAACPRRANIAALACFSGDLLVDQPIQEIDRSPARSRAGALSAPPGAQDLGVFEVHVGPEDNWLPPDNMQEQPTSIVAHRTSRPILHGLVANLAAHDFGYLGIGGLLQRTSNTAAHHAGAGAASRPFLQLV